MPYWLPIFMLPILTDGGGHVKAVTVIYSHKCWRFLGQWRIWADINRLEGDGQSVRGDLLIGWCGMRGLVTLATAFALPFDFPGRDPIVLSAFCVVLGTLVLQGMTLKPLLRWLDLTPDRSLEQEVSRARVVIMQAALDSLDGDTSPAAAAVREQYAAARIVAENTDDPQAATDYDELRLRAIKSQRRALERLRAEGRVGDEAYHRLQEEIDWAELDAAPAGRFQPLMT